MERAQVLFSNGTRLLLEENGRIDALAGRDWYDGWREVCKELGWSPVERTPAQEAYKDGYYKARRK